MNSRRFTRSNCICCPSEGLPWQHTALARIKLGAHCSAGFSTRLMTAVGHVWTAPAVQEESDYQRSVRVRSCIPPLSAAVWPLALM
jgi:hypothetical protein